MKRRYLQIGLLALVCLGLLACLTGCDAGYHWVSDPLRNRAIRVESGDRVFLKLPEPDDCRWLATSDDADAEVRLERGGKGLVKARIRVHRGFDGPATVTFCLKHRLTGEEKKAFTVFLYKRTGDAAFWE